MRSEAPPAVLLRAVQKQLTRVNPEQQTAGRQGDLEAWIADVPEWQQEHLAAWIFGLFAAMALALAAVGLYSVISWTVAQRTNELGIRMALGAQSGDVLRTVCASTLASAAIGVAAGLVLTLALNTMLRHWIAGHSPDLGVLLTGTLLLSLVAAIACAVPARHASAIDPAAALRSE